MVIRKILLSSIYLVGLSLLAFLISRQIPGDPAEVIANIGRENEAPPEMVEKVRQEYGLDKSLSEQYILWCKRIIFQADLGRSLRSRRLVVDEIGSSLPATLKLGAVSLLVTALVAFPLGVIAGLSKNRLINGLIEGFALLGYAIPVFLVANILLWLFSVELDWLPAIGDKSWRHFILPVCALCLDMIGYSVQVIRSSVRDVAARNYLLVAKAKGLKNGAILRRYILKPAMLPIVTTFFLLVGRLISGSFMVEVIFAWNGIGRLLVDSIMGRDYPVIQGLVLLIGALFILINLLIDVSYLILDPQISQRLHPEAD